MRTVEIFCGTKSFSGISASLGHSTFTVDNDDQHMPDLCQDILTVESCQIGGGIDVLWASPPCEGFSVAVIGRNWNHDGSPKHARAELAMKLALKTVSLIEELKPKYWFIENPVGMLRKMPFMQKFHRKTVTYCQYGDTRMKPTDIWTNCVFWNPKPRCSPGAKCHVSAPRGSRTGTQGLKGAVERSRIPGELFIEIFKHLSPTPPDERVV